VGKEISYCQICGKRLGVGEAVENQVYVHEGRRYCSACRPDRATAKIPAPERRKSSTKLRVPLPAARVKETTRVRKRPGPAFAVAAGLALASAIGIAIAAGGRTPEPLPAAKPALATPIVSPVPKVDAGPTLDELLVRIRELRQSDLMFERHDEIRRLLTDAAGKAGPRLEEVDLLAADYDRRFEEAAARLADFTRAEAARMAGKQKFSEAVERLDGFPAAFQSSKAAGPLKRLREDYERRRSAPGAPPASADTSPRQVL
jgi:hypothetical protein